MKKYLSILLAFSLMFLTLLVSGCKKGENDPALSMLPRKARLVGEWKLFSGKITDTPPNDPKTIRTYTDTQLSFEHNGFKETRALDWWLTIERDGSFTQLIQETRPGALTSTETTRGNWAFMYKNKKQDYKNKECVYFTQTYYSTNQGGALSSMAWGNPVTGDIWFIDQLKNKELIIKQTTEVEKADGFHVNDVYLVFRIVK